MTSVAHGKIKEVTSTANPIIKDIKALAMKKNRDREKLFIAEGQKLVTDALQAGWTIRTLLHGKKALDDDILRPQIETLTTKVHAAGGDILIVSDKILSAITRRDNAQTIIAVIEQKLVGLNDIEPAGNDVWLALDRVRDPGNLGTILRTCDALGAKAVVLVGETTDPFALEAVRATMGSLFHIPLMRATESDFIAFMDKWKNQHKGATIGTHLKGSVDHRSLDYSAGPQLLLLGNEQQGLTDELTRACSNLVRIPMAGAADSLNLAIASGIMLFEARRHAL